MKLFKEFLKDNEAWDMFITGPAGTGKTTALNQKVQWLEEMKYKYVVCAFTHKACGVLRSKLDCDPAKVQTLHKFLRKRPTINDNAKNVQQLESNKVMGEADEIEIILIDEFSQVGEQDLMDLRSLQDPDYDGLPGMKIVWIGDLNQLPPVKDAEAVKPREPYWEKLTKIHRTDSQPLMNTMAHLVRMIEGEEPAPLERHEAFIEVEDVVEAYKDCDEDKVLLCYTNYKVQENNFELQGRDHPLEGDLLFCNSVNDYYTFIREVPAEEIAYVDTMFGDQLGFNSKYKTLEFIIASGMCKFYHVSDDEGDEYIFPSVFGTYNYKDSKNKLAQAATNYNARIQKETGQRPAEWAKINYQHPTARQRAKAWREYLTFKDLLCFDFTHSMTVHKSQGSTFQHVYIDAQDLYQCATHDFRLYLRLYYVAISRAAKKVITN